MNSVGSASEENAKYLDSIGGKVTQFKSAFEDLSRKLIDSDLIKFFVDLGTTGIKSLEGISNVLGKITSMFGLLNSSTGGTVGALSGLVMNMMGGGALHWDSKNKMWNGWFSGFTKNSSYGLNPEIHGLFSDLKKGDYTLSGLFDGSDDDVKARFNALGITSEKDIKNLKEFSKVTKDQSVNLKTYQKYLKDSGQATSAFTKFTSGAKNMLKSFAGSLASMGVNMLIGMGVQAISDFMNRHEVAAQKAMESFEEAKSEYESVDSLINEYENLKRNGVWDTTAQNRAKEIQQEITNLVGDQAKGLDLVNGELETQLRLLGSIEQKTREQYRSESHLAQSEAGEDLWSDVWWSNQNVGKNWLGWTAPGKIESFNDLQDLVNSDRAVVGKYIDALNILANGTFKDFGQFMWVYEEMETLYGELLAQGKTDSEGFEIIQDFLNHFKGKVENYRVTESAATAEDIIIDLSNILNSPEHGFGGSIDSPEEFKKLMDVVDAYWNKDDTRDYYNEFVDYLTKMFPTYSNNLFKEQKQSDAEVDISNVVKGVTDGNIDSLEEYKTVVEAIKEVWSAPEDTAYLNVLLEILGEKYPRYANQAKAETIDFTEVFQASSKKIQSASEGIASLSSAFKELSDDGYITLDSISKIKTAVGDSIPNWQEYEKILMTAKVGSTEFNVAMGELTYAILEEKIGLTELANADEAYIARILKENGVLNYNETAHQIVTRAKAQQMAQSYATADASDITKENLLAEAESCGIAANAYIELVAKEIIFNNNSLSVEGKIEALYNLATAAGVAAGAIQTLSTLQNIDVKDGVALTQFAKSTGGSIEPIYDENGKFIYNEYTASDGSVFNNVKDYGLYVGSQEFFKGIDPYTPDIKPNYSGSGSKGGGGSKKNEALDKFLKDAERAYKTHQDETRYIKDLKKAYDELAKTDEERLEIADKIEAARQAYADNRIKDIKHEIEMTKNLKGENADVKKFYEEIMTIANEEADRIRTRLSEMGLDSETIEKTDEIQKWQKEWWSAYKELANNDYNISESWIEERNDRNDWDLFGDSELAAWRRVLSRFETEYPELVDKIKDIRKKVSDAMRKEFDDRLELSETYISNQETLGWKAGDNEIAARTRVLEWIQSEYYRSLIESDEEYRDILIENYGKYKDAIDNGLSSSLTSIEEQRDKIVEKLENENDAIDEQISKEEGLLSVRQKEFDVINKIAEAQHEADKSIATSRISKQYLSDDEYAPIFNEEDYEKMTGRYEDIGKDVAKITEDFNKQIEDAYANDQTYLIESITAEYERQMSMKERELEIIQAEYDLKKKEIALENALAEKNVKKFVERDGKVYAEWVADADKVRQATEDFAESQYEFNRLNKEKSQQLELDYKQVSIDNLANMKSANEKQIEMMDEAVEKVSKEIEKLTEPTISLYNAMSMFEAVGVTSLSNAVNDMLDVFSGVTNKKYESIVKPNGLVVKAGSDGWAEGGLPVGTTVETEGGNYLITKVNTDGTYESEKLTPYKVSGYANGIFSAAKGIRQVNEKGEETYISPDGIFHNFSGGEPVFNSIQTQNLWKLSKGILPTSLPNITKVPNNNGGVNNTLHGDIIIQNPADFNDFVRKLTRVITQKSNGI